MAFHVHIELPFSIHTPNIVLCPIMHQLEYVSSGMLMNLLHATSITLYRRTAGTVPGSATARKRTMQVSVPGEVGMAKDVNIRLQGLQALC